MNKIARYLHETASKAIKSGKTLAEALKTSGVDVVTTEPFSAMSGFPDDNEDVVYALTKSIMAYNMGELTDIIHLEDGVAFAWIKSRKSADNTVFQGIRNDLGMFIRRKRAETVFYEWQEYLLKQAGFEDDTVKRQRAAELPEDESEDDQDMDI